MKRNQLLEGKKNHIHISWRESEKHLLDRASDSGQGLKYFKISTRNRGGSDPDRLLVKEELISAEVQVHLVDDPHCHITDACSFR